MLKESIMRFQTRGSAFTLPELMIVMILMGVVMISLLPKIGSTDKYRRNAAAKQVASAVTKAYANLKVKEGAGATTNFQAIMNYASNATLKTTGTLDDHLSGSGTLTCGSSHVCYKLGSGATVAAASGNSFGGTADANAIQFYVDTDSEAKAGNAKSKSVSFLLRFDGHLAEASRARGDTLVGGGAYSNCINCTPAWFKW
jgi:prepilin-type N-terminal cleavage/methylation domain-containing protein